MSSKVATMPYHDVYFKSLKAFLSTTVHKNVSFVQICRMLKCGYVFIATIVTVVMEVAKFNV